MNYSPFYLKIEIFTNFLIYIIIHYKILIPYLLMIRIVYIFESHVIKQNIVKSHLYRLDMTNNKTIKYCWNCGSRVENTELHTYYCEKCQKIFVLNNKNIHLVCEH